MLGVSRRSPGGPHKTKAYRQHRNVEHRIFLQRSFSRMLSARCAPWARAIQPLMIRARTKAAMLKCSSPFSEDPHLNGRSRKVIWATESGGPVSLEAGMGPARPCRMRALSSANMVVTAQSDQAATARSGCHFKTSFLYAFLIAVLRAARGEAHAGRKRHAVGKCSPKTPGENDMRHIHPHLHEWQRGTARPWHMSVRPLGQICAAQINRHRLQTTGA